MKREKRKGYIYKSYRFSGMVSLPIVFGLSGIAKVFVPVFLGPGYDLVEVLLPLMSVNIIAIAYAYVTGYAYLISTKQQNVYTMSVTVGAVASLFLDFLLIPRFGVIGAAIASVSAEVIGASIQIIYCCAKKQLLINTVFSSLWKYFVAASTMLISLLLTRSYITTSFVGLLLLILQGIAVYVLFLILLRDDFFLKTINDILMRIQKIKKIREAKQK